MGNVAASEAVVTAVKPLDDLDDLDSLTESIGGKVMDLAQLLGKLFCGRAEILCIRRRERERTADRRSQGDGLTNAMSAPAIVSNILSGNCIFIRYSYVYMYLCVCVFVLFFMSVKNDV